MVQLPDSIKPHAATLAKHRFWILAAFVPLLLLPAVLSAIGLLQQAIASERSKIDSHVTALRSIQSEPEHPNDQWVTALDDRTRSVRKELLDEWRRFWESQQPLRTWSPQLGPEFLAEMQRVEAGRQQELILQNRLVYRDTIPDIVRTLPERMGCQELMSDRSGAEGLNSVAGRSSLGPGGGLDELDTPEASLTFDPLVWKAEDQRRLIGSFTWTGEPSTTQVRLAQEELWVYGLFCDAIKSLNAGAKGAFDATITTVEELAVGYPAAEEGPGGRGGKRILWKVTPAAVAGALEGEGAEMPAMDAGGQGLAESLPGRLGIAGRPPHPRFTTGGNELMPGISRGQQGGAPPGAVAESGEGEAGGDAISADDALRQWIYVDFEGRPLTAVELRTAPDARMVHLVPFTLRVVIDQRKIDSLLGRLAGGDIPIDVRQIRINPSSQPALAGGPLSALTGGALGQSEFGSGGLPDSDKRRRPFDVTLELRGTVGLATAPDETILGAEPDDAADGGAP